MSILSILAVIVLAIGLYLSVILQGPSYSKSVPGVIPWPLFHIATRVSSFLRTSFLASNPGALLHLYHGIIYTAPTSLYVVAKLGVADVIKDGSVHYKTIASEVNASPQKLFRVIRYLTSEGYFVLSKDGFVSLTANGQYLRSDREDSMRWCSIHWNEEAAESMHNLYNEVLTGEEAFVKSHGADIFTTYSKRPASQEAFTKCMKGLNSITIPAVIAEYDFSQHHTLLDLGGGMGFVSQKILEIYDTKAVSSSKLSKAIVFDLETVVKHGVVEHPILKYVAGSFFDLKSIPTGADVIVINGVLHDWNDEECVQILSNAASAMAEGGRIIVMDIATPNETDAMFYSSSQLDIFMMTVSSGYFRTAEEYAIIWSQAKLKLIELRPTRSLQKNWILEK